MKIRIFRTAAATLMALSLTFVAPVIAHADTYNCGAYGSGSYQNNVCGASTDSGSSDSSSATDSGSLANTGQNIATILIAVTLIAGGTYLLYRTRKNMKKPAHYTHSK